jgi:hypothetical protein
MFSILIIMFLICGAGFLVHRTYGPKPVMVIGGILLAVLFIYLMLYGNKVYY